MPASRLLYRPRGEHSLSHLGPAILGCSTHPEGPGQPQLLPPLPVAPRVAGGFREDHVSPREASLIPAGAAPDPSVRDPSISHGTKQLYSHNRLCKSWRPHLPPGTRPSSQPQGPLIQDRALTHPQRSPGSYPGSCPMSVAWEEGQCYRELCSLGGEEGGERSPPSPPQPQPQSGSPSPSGPSLPPPPAAPHWPLQQHLLLPHALTCVYNKRRHRHTHSHMHLHTGTDIHKHTRMQVETQTCAHTFVLHAPKHIQTHANLCGYNYNSARPRCV